MDGNKIPNGENDDMELEIKIEPTVQGYTDEENGGFTGFDNPGTIPSTADVGALNLWTSKATTCLITQYKKFRSMVGQSQIRSLREMFEMISLEMQKFGFYFSPQKCENKWRVLERKYKNLVFRERLKKPGRMRHYGHWEHKRALDEIFNEKKKHMYLEEKDFSPPSSASNKYALILPKPNTENGKNTAANHQVLDDQLATTTVSSQNVKKTEETGELKGPLFALFEKFLAKTERNFIVEQQNKERRHKEKMALRHSELEIQKKLFKLKEQKMELKKSKLVAAAQHLHLNM